MGKIMLTLRRPDESDEAAGEEATPLAEILSGRAKLASEPVHPAGPPAGGSGFLTLVKGAVAAAAAAPASDSNTAAPPAAEPVWVMDIMSPAERKRYEWTDRNQLPTETVVGSPAAASSGPSVGSSSQPPRGPESLENPDKPGVIDAPDAGADGAPAIKDGAVGRK
jgi:hypothetical protein